MEGVEEKPIIIVRLYMYRLSLAEKIILPGNLYPYLTAEDHYWTASIKKREVKGLKVKAFFLFLKPQHVKNWKIFDLSSKPKLKGKNVFNVEHIIFLDNFF